MFPGEYHVVKYAENNHSDHQYARIVHICSSDWDVYWPEAEEKDQNQIEASTEVDEYSESSPEMPGTPNQACAHSIRDHSRRVRSIRDAAGAAPVEDERNCDQIAEVQTGHGKRDNDVEGKYRADENEG